MLRLVLTATALSILGGCTFLLDFDTPVSAEEDADASVDSGADATVIDAMVDAQTVLYCAASEDNNSLSQTKPLPAGTLEAAICPNTDLDFYSFELAMDVDLTISLSFDNTTSDLNLHLFDAMGSIVASATGTGALEEIIRGPGTVDALDAGNYRVEVVALDHDASLDYTLTLSRTPAM